MIKHKLLAGLLTVTMVLGIAVFAVSAGTPQVSMADDSVQTERQVVVNGSGEIQVEPDMATINLGVQTQDADAAKAQSDNAKIMDQVVKAIKALNVEADDIQTSQYNLYQTSNYLEGDAREDYYVANNTLTVKVKDIKKVGDIIDAASKNGANSINSINFSVSDDSEYYKKALELAMANAKGKATAIMGTFNATPGLPVSVVEASYGGGVVYSTESYRTLAMDMSTPIEAGNLTISANVTVTYGY